MANEKVIFLHGPQERIPTSGEAYTFYLTEDSARLYAADSNGTVKLLNQTVQIVDRVEDLSAENANANDFYYCTVENILAVFDGAEWVQINPDTDTGATSVEVIGDGNAVTSASYDATARKVTLTLGETFATSEELNTFKEYVGTYPSDEVDEEGNKKYENVVDYVIQVATGGSTESAASVKAQLDAYKASNDAAVAGVSNAASAAQSAADEAKDVAETAQIAAEGAQSTANEAKSAAEAAQNEVNAVEGRMDTAEGEIDAIQETLAKIANPMIYKGVVNSDVELTTKNAEVGHTYMVGEPGTYENHEAEKGDLFIWDGEAWNYIPAGDDAELDTQYSLEVSGGTITLKNTTTNTAAGFAQVSNEAIVIDPGASVGKAAIQHLSKMNDNVTGTATIVFKSDTLDIIPNANNKSIDINLTWGTF